MLRRTFEQGAIFVLGGLIGAGLGIPAAVYLFAGGKKAAGGEEGWTDAGPLNSLPEGKPTQLIVQREKQDAWRSSIEDMAVWALREGDQAKVYSPVCPHLGCGVRWDPDRDVFQCPCHDSAFNKAGEVLGGPAPRGLDELETRVEGGRLWLGQVREATEA